jgi:hypothetical protein
VRVFATHTGQLQICGLPRSKGRTSQVGRRIDIYVYIYIYLLLLLLLLLLILYIYIYLYVDHRVKPFLVGGIFLGGWGMRKNKTVETTRIAYRNNAKNTSKE